MDQRSIAAHHEAGHVVVRTYYGLKTPAFFIHEDGTGVTAPSTGLIFDLEVQIDVALAGTVAEDIVLMQEQAPTIDDIEDSIDTLSCGNEIHEDWFGDLEDAINIIQLRYPKWTNDAILAEIRTSYNRCVTTLKRSWPTVEQLATEALQSPRGAVYEDAIERICASTPRD